MELFANIELLLKVVMTKIHLFRGGSFISSCLTKTQQAIPTFKQNFHRSCGS